MTTSLWKVHIWPDFSRIHRETNFLCFTCQRRLLLMTFLRNWVMFLDQMPLNPFKISKSSELTHKLFSLQVKTTNDTTSFKFYIVSYQICWKCLILFLVLFKITKSIRAIPQIVRLNAADARWGRHNMIVNLAQIGSICRFCSSGFRHKELALNIIVQGFIFKVV